MNDIRLQHERLTNSLTVVKKRAIKIIQTEEVFPNIVFVIGMDFAEPIPFMFENNGHKKFLVSVIRGYAKAKNAIGIIMASDAWIATMPHDGKAIDVNTVPLPSRSPNREQAIIISATGEQFSKGCAIQYTREHGKIVLGEETNLDGMEDLNWGSLFAKKFDA